MISGTASRISRRPSKSSRRTGILDPQDLVPLAQVSLEPPDRLLRRPGFVGIDHDRPAARCDFLDQGEAVQVPGDIGMADLDLEAAIAVRSVRAANRAL